MLYICRSSRLEHLAQALADSLWRHQPASVLAPQRIVIGHLGMKRWLQQWLATQRQHGRPRLAANLQMLLPSEWLQQKLEELALEAPQQLTLPLRSDAPAPGTGEDPARHAAAWRREQLRWHIYALLPQLEVPELARLRPAHAAQQAGASAATDELLQLRRFQLADQLAGLYARYLVYRRADLLAWSRGRPGSLGEHWQASLWRALQQRLGAPPMPPQDRELAALLRSLPANPEQPMLQVFGVSHLPPEVLRLLLALAPRQPATIYFPDPCRELWSDLRTRREQLRAEPDGAPWLQLEHPLLASLGRRGQHFALQLDGLAEAAEVRDPEDLEAPAPAPDAPLLARVQHGIRVLDASAAAGAASLHDASLRVHACHTRLRELEVLRDALLDRLQALPDLEPRQIIVMAPDMAAYAPLLPAVFGPPGQYGGPLPYHLADLPLRLSHPLLASFEALLDLPARRLTQSEVLALLSLPAVQRALGLDDSQLQALTRWLARSHVAWGLDAEMKASFGAAAVDMHSFSFAFDRMAAGLLLGNEDADLLLAAAEPTLQPQPILPARPVQGPDMACLGALWQLLELLGEWRLACQTPRPLAAWLALLEDWLPRLFRADEQDEAELQAVQAMHRCIGQLQAQVAALADAPLHWSLLAAALRQTLQEVPERQAFLVGGISFCGMVPQRAIPFRVVALLGLNDGEYPRGEGGAELDLMAARPRVGDRDTRHDDRYLFLEALMSARDALHLSYLGQAVEDGSELNPAQPLAELCQLLQDQHGGWIASESPPGDAGSDAAGPRRYDAPWWLQHPLQPFDQRYFDLDRADRDPRLYSYQSGYAAAGTATQAPAADAVAAGMAAATAATGPAWRFLDTTAATPTAGMVDEPSIAAAADLPAAAPTPPTGIELKQLLRFYRQPARWLCEQHLRLSRQALENSLVPDEEPLESSLPPLDQTVAELVHAALRQQRPVPATLPPRLARSGRLSPGPIGDTAWAQMRTRACALHAAAIALPPFASGPPQRLSMTVTLQQAPYALSGSIDGIYLAGESLWLVQISQSATLDYKQLLPWYLQWLCLRLAQPERDVQAALVHRNGKHAELGNLRLLGQGPAASDIDELQQTLSWLLQGFEQAASSSRLYLPRSSHAYAEKLRKDPAATAQAAQAARQSWEGGKERTGERDFQPGYNRLIDDPPLIEAHHPQHDEAAAFARRLWLALADGGCEP